MHQTTKKGLAIAPRPVRATPLPTPATRSKKSRTSRPKVRTGCASCKIRRIKCDEQKPTCKKCRIDGFDCSSYENHAQRTPTSANNTTMPVSGGLPLLAIRNPQSAAFNQQDALYFDFFKTELIYELSGYSHSDFWCRIVICESTLDKCALESVLALGALSTAIRLTPQLPNRSSPARRPSVVHPWSTNFMANVHHKAAVCHYIKALSMFRSRLERGVREKSPRSIFIISMLFITFEMLQGDMCTADSLITRSINILKDTLKLHRQDIYPEQELQLSRRSMEADIEDIEHLLPLLSIMSGYTPFLHSQSSNIQLWDPSKGIDLPDTGQSSIDKLHIQWSKFNTRAVAFIGGTMGFQLLPGFMQQDKAEQQSVLLGQLRVWEMELDLWSLGAKADIRQPIHKRTLQIMQIQRQMLFICVSSCLDTTELSYDAQEAGFYALLTRCARYLHESRPTYQFTLSTSILSALLVVVNRCRVHNTRMMAAGLLRTITWREGAWEPALMLHGKLGGVLMEERERDWDGFIAPECRWFWAGAEWDAERKHLVASYIRAVPDAKRGPDRKTLVLDPDRCFDVCSDVGCFVDHDIGIESLIHGLQPR